MAAIDRRRKCIAATGGMRIVNIRGRSTHTEATIGVPEGEDILSWIERCTTGDFYLSDYSIGFRDEYDVLMFKLAFKR